MIGITSFGAYLPFLRLNRSTISSRLKGERPLANFDEDSLTMGVAAVVDCLCGIDRQSVDGLFFASTTSPYQEKEAATTIATAADLRHDIITADYANSLKAGTSALRSAIDSVLAETANQVMVAAADMRLAEPGSLSEYGLGDGSAAILIGKDNVLATLEGRHSICHEIIDTWRIDGSPYIRSWEGRFTETEGYQKAMGEVVSMVLEKTNLTPSDITKVVFNTSTARSSSQLCGKLGFNPKTQLQDPLFSLIGDTGTPYAMMLLVAALEESNPGDIILLANYGNGADAFVFKVTDKIKDLVPRGGIKNHLASKSLLENYRTYLYYRGILPGMASLYPESYGDTSAPAIYREADQILRMYAGKCDQCGTVQYPPQRTCVKCHSKDQFHSVRLSDKKGKIFSYSMDHVSSQINFPAIVCITDFEGGGRADFLMTDSIVKDVKIGMDVEMSFRKFITKKELNNYIWKARPVRF